MLTIWHFIWVVHIKVSCLLQLTESLTNSIVGALATDWQLTRKTNFMLFSPITPTPCKVKIIPGPRKLNFLELCMANLRLSNITLINSLQEYLDILPFITMLMYWCHNMFWNVCTMLLHIHYSPIVIQLGALLTLPFIIPLQLQLKKLFESPQAVDI